jgi:hypothetical protein
LKAFATADVIRHAGPDPASAFFFFRSKKSLISAPGRDDELSAAT